MTRRTLAIAISVPLMVALWSCALLVPVPYVTYQPGMTVDMLSETGGQERIEVKGHQTYHDGGELRMTTVSVTPAGDSVSVFAAIQAWLDDDEAVQPYSAVYDEDETNESNREESAMEMSSSQHDAIAAALRELGEKVPAQVGVQAVEDGMPADGKLEVGDQIVSFDGKRITDPSRLVDAVSKWPAGKQAAFVVRRDGKRLTVNLAPRKDGDRARIGVTPAVMGYQFPYDVTINIDPRIGGPSAGLMFSLAIYDTLTPGSLTGGKKIAGTGTITGDGEVGPIGGIQQKIPAVREAGGELFLVPADNCDEAKGAARGDVHLVRVETLEDAISSIETWVDDPDADLPTCEKE